MAYLQSSYRVLKTFDHNSIKVIPNNILEHQFPVHTSGTAPQTHVFPVQTQVVRQTRVVPVQRTAVHGRCDIQSSGPGICIGATVLRVMCAVSNIVTILLP